MFRLASAFADVHGLRSRTKRARIANAERMLRRCLDGARPRPRVAWSIGESLRVAGISWCSGLIGLLAAGHFDDIIGVLWRHRLVTHARSEELLNLLFAAPVAIGLLAFGSDSDLFAALSTARPESSFSCEDALQSLESPDDADALNSYRLECRRTCVLSEGTARNLSDAWRDWGPAKANLIQSDLDRSFPLHIYLQARHLTRAARRFALAIANEAAFSPWF